LLHWGLHGEPNSWATKTFRGVYGPLLFGSGLILLMLMLALAMFYGARRAPLRKPVLGAMIGVLYVIALAFSAAGLLPLAHIPAAALIFPLFGFVAAMIVWSYKVGADAPSEATPDECWTLGGIYYNRNDPAIFVQKRIGIGYTVNLGNHLSWLILGAFSAGILGLIFLLP
jgi:uncharacterized membrane protein